MNKIYNYPYILLKVLSEEKIKRKIDALLRELHVKTGVSDEEMNEFKKLMELEDFSKDQE